MGDEVQVASRHYNDYSTGGGDNNIHEYHYHYSTGDNYYNRLLYYHDHPGAVIYDEHGTLIHDHAAEPPVYRDRGSSPAFGIGVPGVRDAALGGDTSTGVA